MTTSPSASLRSGWKSVSLLASRRGASPILSGRAARCGPSARTTAPVAALIRGTAGRMVPMGMRHEDMGDGFAAHRIEQGCDMRLVERTGIDDGNLAAADDIGHRSLERERAGLLARMRRTPGATSSTVSGARSKLLSKGISSLMHISLGRKRGFSQCRRLHQERVPGSVAEWISRACAR